MKKKPHFFTKAKTLLAAIIFISTLCLYGNPPSQTEKDPKEYKFSSFLESTRADKNMDWFFKDHTDTAKTPAVRDVYIGERLVMVPFAQNAVKNDGDPYEIKYKLTIFDRAKNEEIILAENVTRNESYPARALINIPFVLEFYFEDCDPYGEHKFKLETESILTNEKASSEITLNLLKWETPMPAENEEAINEIIVKFPDSFNPQNLYSAFTSERLNFYQMGAWHGLNPLFYSFFKHGFLKHAFLAEKLRNDFKTLPQTARNNAILLFTFLGESPVNEQDLNEAEKALQEAVRENPKIEDDPYKTLEDAAYLDLLWGEFFATGNYAPIRRILDAFEYNREGDIINGLISRKEALGQNGTEKQRGFVNLMARWSIMSNIDTPLVANYIAFALGHDMSREQSEAFLSVMTHRKAHEHKNGTDNLQHQDIKK